MTNSAKATILGCGYVGQAVARRWRDQGLAVTATTTTPSRVSLLEPLAQQVALIKGSDRPALASLLQDQDLLLVSVGAPRADAYRETYLETAAALAAVFPDTSITQVIYTGSYAVYGDRQGNWVTEADGVAPANEKGEILVKTEQTLLGLGTANRAACVLRLGGIYGPGRELVKIFGRAAGTTRPGAGEDASNWIHLDDIVAAIDFARQQRLTGLYNLVQDEPLTTKALLHHVMQTHNLDPVSWNADEPSDRPYNARVSNQKLKQAGYAFIHPTFPFQ
ncbi:MAG: NAD-dependent epimerase/dehydratase family protein [Elainellaceae cyanobacterium]